jgi:ComF family protein
MDTGFAARKVRNGVSRVAGLVADILTPPRCLACRSEVEDAGALCIGCWSKITFISEPVCDVLGTPFAYEQGHGSISPAALADPPPWDRARAAVAYDEASSGIVHALKYADHHEAALLMARQMARAGHSLLAEADVLVPVPLHYWRLWQRRFNQSALLAGALSRASGKPWLAQALQRVKHSRPQVGLRAEERHKSVARAFAAQGDEAGLIAGRRVVLVDDVLTTGATAAACTKALKAAGAAHVDVLTFALVLGPKRPHIP